LRFPAPSCMLRSMIDFHTHSTCSDGTLKPADLVALAARKGVTALALTDHDTTSGLAEAREAAEKQGLVFINGIELSVEVSRGEFHLLGLGLKTNLHVLEKRLQQILDYRNDRNRQMVDMMNREGITVTYEEISRLAGDKVVGRPHFAAYLVNRGVCDTSQEAFQKFLTPGRPFYMPKQVLTLEEGAERILTAGGIPVVAHPLSLQLNLTDLEARIPRWKDLGIGGLETMHPSANRNRTRRLREMAERNGLLSVAGSDFHGDNMPNRRLGRTGWGTRIPPSYDEVVRRFL